MKGHGREHARRDTDQQDDREALDRAGAEHQHDAAGDGVRHVRLEDGAARFLVAELDGLDDAAPSSKLLADTLVDEHVRVHGGADGQHESCNAGQRQRRIQDAHHAQDDQHVDGNSEIGVGAPATVAGPHEQDDANDGDDGRRDAGGSSLCQARG